MEVASFVALDADDAMPCVDTWVDGVDGAVDVCAQHLAPEDVVAHVQGDDLLEVEAVLDHDDAALLFGIFLFVEFLFALCATKFADANSNSKLLTTILALEDQLLTILILRFIECDETVALWTTYSFHLISSTHAAPMSVFSDCRVRSCLWAVSSVAKPFMMTRRIFPLL